MTATPAKPTPGLKELLSSAQLPALPQSAIRLLELSQNPDNGPAEFAVPIESDPGLTGPGAEVRQLVVLRLLARDFQRQAGDHARRHPHDQELLAVERGLQPDAQPQVRAVRPQEPVAGFAPPGAVRPGLRQAAGPERRRRPVRRRLAARHGDSAAGQGAARPLPEAARRPPRGRDPPVATWSGPSSAGRTPKPPASWPASGACPRNSPSSSRPTRSSTTSWSRAARTRARWPSPSRPCCLPITTTSGSSGDKFLAAYQQLVGRRGKPAGRVVRPDRPGIHRVRPGHETGDAFQDADRTPGQSGHRQRVTAAGSRRSAARKTGTTGRIGTVSRALRRFRW